MPSEPKSLPHWFLRWLATAPSRWLGSSSGLAQDIAGGTHGLTYLRHLSRGNRIRRRAIVAEVDDSSPPVLLIHGFLGTRGSMLPLERRLVADGYCVFSFNLGALNTRDVRRSAFLIHRKIESILSQTSVSKIDIIGHSMGGLIGLYYLKKLGGHSRVRKLIMMGTPVNGTWAALAGVFTLGMWSTSTWQLLPRSRFLDELHKGPLPPGVDVYTVAAARDAVCPLPSTRLRGAHAVTVPLGHSSLVVSENVYRRILAALGGPRPAAGGAASAERPNRADPAQMAAAGAPAAGIPDGEADNQPGSDGDRPGEESDPDLHVEAVPNASHKASG